MTAPDTASMAMSGHSIDYIDGYERGYEQGQEDAAASAAKARAEAFEECAKLCEAEADGARKAEAWMAAFAADQCATAIRRAAIGDSASTAPADEEYEDRMRGYLAARGVPAGIINRNVELARREGATEGVPAKCGYPQSDCERACNKHPQEFCGLNDELRATEGGAPAAPQADAAMLDWLEANPTWSTCYAINTKSHRVKWAMRDNVEHWGQWHDTMRAAISAVIAASGGSGTPARYVPERADARNDLEYWVVGGAAPAAPRLMDERIPQPHSVGVPSSQPPIAPLKQEDQ